MPKIRYNTHTHNKTPEPAEVCAPDVLKRFRMCVRKRGRGQFSSTQSSTVRSGSLVILQSLLGSSSTHPLELQRTRVRHIVSRLTLVGRGARGAFRSALADHHRTGQAHLRESDRASSRESATPRGGGEGAGISDRVSAAVHQPSAPSASGCPWPPPPECPFDGKRMTPHRMLILQH